MRQGNVPAALAEIGPFFAVAVHPAGAAPAPPWRPVSDLTGPAGPAGPLAARVAAARTALAARGGQPVAAIELRAAASAVHLGIVARLTAPALGAAVLGCPLDLRPAGLWWQDAAQGPVPLAVPESAPGEWTELLLEHVLAPITAATADLVPVSDRVLWGNVASAINTSAAQLAAHRQDLAAKAWQTAAGLFASYRLRSEPHPPGPAFRRSSCCLFYRLIPGSQVQAATICGDCVLRAAPGRRPD
jgi:hypothetical protein